MKFPTTEKTRQVRGSQYNSRECYNKLLKLVEKEKKLPHVMEVGIPSARPMETNIDLCLQEDESAAGPIKELIEVPN